MILRNQVKSTPAEPPISPQVDLVIKALQDMVQRGLERLGDRKDGEPIRELHLELTHRCNLKCVMCHHWEMPFKDPASVKREMGLEEIRKMVDGSELLKDLEIICITGGEPMLRADIADIAALLSERYPRARIGILSNFWNTELVRAKLTALLERGVRQLWLGSSLDGLEETHDRIRGEKGAFRGLVRTAEMMKADFPAIQFSFNFTITPKNYPDLWPAYRFVKDMGLWFGAQMVVNHEGFEAPETFQWKDEELAEVERQIDLILESMVLKENALQRLLQGDDRQALWLWTSVLYWWYLRKYGRKPERFFKDCLAGQRYAMFDPEGNLFYCPVNKHRKIGSVREKSFDQIWTSAKADSERKYVDSCRCHCWLNCISNPILDRLADLGTAKK